MATHSRILAWRIPWTEEPGKAIVHGVTESDMTEGLQAHTHTHTGEAALLSLAALKCSLPQNTLGLVFWGTCTLGVSHLFTCLLSVSSMKPGA